MSTKKVFDWLEADPVRNRAGRCVVGPRHQLVRFEDQVEVVVVRRCLRLLSKCKIHGKDEQ